MGVASSEVILVYSWIVGRQDLKKVLAFQSAACGSEDVETRSSS